MTHRREVRLVAAGAVAAVVLGVASTIALAASGVAPAGTSSARRCAVPTLAGAVVQVTLADMGAMMGRRHRPGPMTHTPQWRPGRGMVGMMWMSVSPGEVSPGTVSLRAVNLGAWTHELLVLPLPAGRRPGQRPVGADGKVDESGSLGEASGTCHAGSGDGIAAGSSGWTTLTLAPGRYELLCNLPGHYPSGMYTELDVTG